MNVKRARETIAKALKEDEGLRISYRVNIAMMIYDYQYKRDGFHHFSVTDCNDVADDLIKLIFGENELKDDKVIEEISRFQIMDLE